MRSVQFGKISIHAPPRGATSSRMAARSSALGFQFTPLREGRLTQAAHRGGHSHFNSRPSARGDDPAAFDRWMDNISIHAPPRGATCFGMALHSRFVFQFTPLREGRRSLLPLFDFTHKISIHAPPRGATSPARAMTRSSGFQFTPLREGRLSGPVMVSPALLFQFTPLREGRQGLHARKGMNTIFQFTPLREGRPEVADGICAASEFQFTPLREGRRRSIRSSRSRGAISIHAPPRGATDMDRVPYGRIKISIHAPPRGATTGVCDAVMALAGISIHAPPRGATLFWLTVSTLPEFQFTPLREGRRRAKTRSDTAPHFNSRPSARGDGDDGKQIAVVDISIHAPPRGATAVPAPEGLAPQFQFTPLREGRPVATPCAPMRSIPFQFTPLREGRLPMPCRCSASAYFNSRPSARGDSNTRLMEDAVAFQFTPLREGRPFPRVPRRGGRDISIHAPPRGATPWQCPADRRWTYFNSRPSARGDWTAVVRRGRWDRFQFTPLREGRRQKICNFCKSFVQPLQISMA